MTVVLPTEATKAALNEDPEFIHAARYWTASVRFVVGDTDYLLQVNDGAITHFGDRDIFEPYQITIGGPEEGWAQLLKPEPPPFYQDFFGAFFRHGFEMGGDLESLYAHYDAIRRLLQTMRASATRQEA